MKHYQVQYIMPVDNPEDNVVKTRVKDGYIFHVPVNHPKANRLGFSDLLEAHERGKNIHTVHTP
jgi:hypothetical protein